MFCRAAVLRIDRKEFCLIQIRSLTPRQATGLALAFAVQYNGNILKRQYTGNALFILNLFHLFDTLYVFSERYSYINLGPLAGWQYRLDSAIPMIR